MRSLLVALSLIAVSPIFSDPGGRMLLALYDSNENADFKAHSNTIHQVAEMPLNWLGFYLRYHDMAEGLPSDDLTRQADGVITWFWTPEMKDPTRYLSWLQQQLEAGKRIVIMGNFGAYVDSETKQAVPLDRINSVFNLMGLQWIGNWTQDPNDIKISYLSKEMMNFETELKPSELVDYQQVRSIDQKNEVYLTLDRTDIDNGKSDVVVATPNGGFVLSGYGVQFNAENNQRRWFLNPFLFFAKAFDTDGWPCLDTTTLFGRRIFFAHIDGNGFLDASQIADDTTGAQVILRQVVRKYPMPVSVSFVSCEIDPYFFGTAEGKSLADDYFREGNVEPAMHSFSNPYNWGQGITTYVIDDYSKPVYFSFAKQAVINGSGEKPNAAQVTVDFDVYLETETKGSTEYGNTYIAPPSKPVALFLWTGNYLPPIKALAEIRSMGIPSMNGGQSRMDESHPTYTDLAPLARQVGSEVQPYAAISSDSLFTNYWTEPLYGMLYALDTFSQTEIPSVIDSVPRRVKPINVYYHFNSGIYPTALGALQRVYEAVMARETIPITASTYAQMVLDFYRASIEPLTGGRTGWRIANYGQCRTLRFHETTLYPDLEASKGVLGFEDWGGYRYIHLSEGAQADLVLSQKAPTQPYLVYAESIPTKMQISEAAITFTTTGWRKQSYRFANLPSSRNYTAIVTGTSHQPLTLPVQVTEEGILQIDLPLNGTVTVAIQPS